MKFRVALICVVLTVTMGISLFVFAGKVSKSSCSYKGKKLYGKVQKVTSFPSSCGKWQFVTSFPDIKVQFVSSFPDIKIQYVTSFPGAQ